MGERYRNDKKAKEFIHSIADVETARIADQVASARFISVLSDGSTDNSITEQEAVYVRYVYNGQVYTRLANIVALSSASADGIEAGPRLNIKTVLSTYGDFHVKDKTAARTSYL